MTQPLHHQLLIEALLARQAGLLMLSAPFGSWELAVALALRLSTFNQIIKPMCGVTPITGSGYIGAGNNVNLLSLMLSFSRFKAPRSRNARRVNQYWR